MRISTVRVFWCSSTAAYPCHPAFGRLTGLMGSCSICCHNLFFKVVFFFMFFHLNLLLLKIQILLLKKLLCSEYLRSGFCLHFNFFSDFNNYFPDAALSTEDYTFFLLFLFLFLFAMFYLLSHERLLAHFFIPKQQHHKLKY